MLEGDLRPISDLKTQTRWFTHDGHLITFDDEHTRGSKVAWAVSFAVLSSARAIADAKI